MLGKIQGRIFILQQLSVLTACYYTGNLGLAYKAVSLWTELKTQGKTKKERGSNNILFCPEFSRKPVSIVERAIQFKTNMSDI